MLSENWEASRIRLLPDEVINQIAAGEIVERPAHLVKELVENSLDAHATDIHVEVSEDGRSFLRVQDNGIGMLPEELPWALRRHATSKIKTTEDLWRLMSFGFRGEALASASSVARVTVTSKAQGANQAHTITAEFGQMGKVQEATHPQGTTVEVYDLFAKLPARLKFLKSEAYEIAQMRQTVKAMSLAYPEVSFRFKVGSRLDFFYPRESLTERVKNVLDTHESVFHHHEEWGSFHMDFVFLSPTQKAKNNKNIWLFVQNRWVTDRSLLAAIQEAYRDILMQGEYPQAVLKLQVAPHEVDVNIHPTKSQVKFQDGGRVFSFVVRGIRQALQSGMWRSSQASAGVRDGNTVLQEETHPLKEEKESFVEEGNRSLISPSLDSLEMNRNESVLRKNETPASKETSSLSFSKPIQMNFTTSDFRRTQYAQKKDYSPAGERARVNWPEELRRLGEGLSHKAIEFQESPKSLSPTGVESLENRLAQTSTREAGIAAGYWSSLQIIGQAHLTYIVTQGPKGLVIIDQHAAHERMRYEILKKEWEQGPTAWQALLVPLVMDFSAEKIEVLLRYSAELQRMGIELVASGPHSLSLTRHSSYLKPESVPSLIDELAQELLEHGYSEAFERKKEHWLATQACHGSIRAGEALSFEQMRELLKKMDEFPLSSFCPHGRPVAVEYTWSELEKDFCRVL
jgi:DNA mismatch repair protein MutL